jgi:hypothetical protein
MSASRCREDITNGCCHVENARQSLARRAPAEMEWKKTRFPGCEVKGLLLDQQTGLVTALMRLAPGAVLPDHEHVKIEQTYMLEGKLVDTGALARSALAFRRARDLQPSGQVEFSAFPQRQVFVVG